MDATVQKWGNSLALRIPSAVAKDVNLRQGAVVDVAVVQGKLVVEPKKRQAYSLSTMLKGITKTNRHAEQQWGGPMGHEAW
ncbi:MAG: AbrB/MazE/SpoVT family DNA-binding domain-containing protein [Elusimicrobia bacterium]|nr:AbrB/MazE/SpoVT family DNA-binding domain-containing protein [Elusimicrobiota bacterium]